MQPSEAIGAPLPRASVANLVLGHPRSTPGPYPSKGRALGRYEHPKGIRAS